MSEKKEIGEISAMSDDRFPAPGAAALAADGSLLLGARRIPLPASVSPQARAFLAMPRVMLGERPPLADKEAWRRWVTTMNLGSEPRVAQMMALVGDRVRLATREIAGVVVHVATPAESHPARRDWLRITVHGGGLVYMGGSYARAEAGLVALQSGGRGLVAEREAEAGSQRASSRAQAPREGPDQWSRGIEGRS